MKWTLAGAAAMALLVAGCGTTTQERVTGGAAAGAATGAGVGALAGPVGVLGGAAIGGLAGGVTGAVTEPSTLNLGRPPWNNPNVRIPPDERVAERPYYPEPRGIDASPDRVAAAPDPLVRQVQIELNERGYDAGPVDGIYGPLTARALRNFQQTNDVDVTGRINQATLQALDLSGGASQTGGPGQTNRNTTGAAGGGGMTGANTGMQQQQQQQSPTGGGASGTGGQQGGSGGSGSR